MEEQTDIRYKMNTKERNQYFKEYYLKSKGEKKDNQSKEVDKPKKKRGRPKKVQPPFKIIHLDKPITLDW